jgi:ribonuclease T2
MIAPFRLSLLLIASLGVSSGIFLGAFPAAAQFRGGSGGGRDDCVLDRCQDRDDPLKRTPRGDRDTSRGSRDNSRSDRYGPRSDQSDGDQSFGDQSRGNRSRRGQAGGSAPGQFDFYVLALSWSSSFCANGDNSGRDQCRIGSNNGFVVHGLWPQYDRGFPSDCDSPVRNLPASVMRDAAGVFPEEGLARYEWRKHGTCSGRSPGDYIADVRRARDKIVIPEDLQQPKSPQRLAPLDIQRAFVDANRGLRPGMMTVACQRGMLQEVRICLSKDLRDFVPCPEVARSACRSQQINVPAVH